MNLKIITPKKEIIETSIDVFERIHEGKTLTNVMVGTLETYDAMVLHHILEYHSIRVHVGTDYSLILNVPEEILQQEDYILLNYSTT